MLALFFRAYPSSYGHAFGALLRKQPLRSNITVKFPAELGKVNRVENCHLWPLRDLPVVTEVPKDVPAARMSTGTRAEATGIKPP